MDNIQVENIKSVKVIRFNRPGKKNAFTIDMYQSLSTILKNASADANTKVVVFSSTSDCFSAGNDIIDFRDNPPIDDDAPVYEFVRLLAKFEKPMIAAVDGLAVGIGFTMLLHCDFVYVTKKSKLIAPFVNLGLVPEAGSTKLLVELIGERAAAEILILGESISGSKAVDLGIANQVVEVDELESRALSTAEILTKKPSDALRLSKELIRPRDLILEAVEKEIVYFKKQVVSLETKEAISAILEKRKPDFTNLKG